MWYGLAYISNSNKIAGWSNGRTAAFEAVYLGSNPSPAANMSNYEKYVKGKSYEEMMHTLRNAVPGGDVYELLRLEINKIQQDTNNIQTAKLIEEIEELKSITEKNVGISKQEAASSNKLSKIAIAIAVIGIILQVIFSIRNKSGCIWSSVSTSDPKPFHSGCYRQFDFGLLGVYTYSLPDHY